MSCIPHTILGETHKRYFIKVLSWEYDWPPLRWTLDFVYSNWPSLSQTGTTVSQSIVVSHHMIAETRRESVAEQFQAETVNDRDHPATMLRFSAIQHLPTYLVELSNITVCRVARSLCVTASPDDVCLVAWSSGRASVFGRCAFAVLCSLMGDHLCG